MAAVELARGAQDLAEGAPPPQRARGRPGRQRVRPTKSDDQERPRRRSSPIAGGRRLGVEVDQFGGRRRRRRRRRLVTCGPAIEPPGRRGLVVRCFAIQANGSRHYGLRLRPGRAVVEALFAFAPAAVVAEPLERPVGRSTWSGIRTGVSSQFAQRFGGVVAAERRSRAGRSRRRRRSRRRSRASRPPGRRSGACLPSAPCASSQSARSPPACWKRMISLGSSCQRRRRRVRLRR